MVRTDTERRERHWHAALSIARWKAEQTCEGHG
jgi:hypothetical protein